MSDPPSPAPDAAACGESPSFTAVAPLTTDEVHPRLQHSLQEQQLVVPEPCSVDTVRFPAVVVSRKTGSEPFHVGGTKIGFDLLTFWQWAASDLTNNALRGTIAEYLVARALNLGEVVRVEWDRYDLRLPSGVSVEVKSAAYCQTWAQTKHSHITFQIAATKGWDSASNTVECTPRRQADVYVFALLQHRDKATLDPLNVEQWTFFVIRTTDLNAAVPKQRTIRLNSLMKLRPTEATFATLRETVERVFAVGT